MGELQAKPNPLMAYRELESTVKLLLAACEREELDAVMAEIGRREEVQKQLETLQPGDLIMYRDEILEVLERIRLLDREIEPKLKRMLVRTGEKLRSASNSRKLLDLYLKKPRDIDANFLDRRG